MNGDALKALADRDPALARALAKAGEPREAEEVEKNGPTVKIDVGPDVSPDLVAKLRAALDQNREDLDERKASTLDHLDAPIPYTVVAPICPVFMSTDSAVRKQMPVASGCLNYFPDALLLVSWVSRVGNDKHNPGQPLHWAKEKSGDEFDAEVRHMLDHFRGLPPDPGLEPLGDLGHLASKAWRALAHLQRACDQARLAHEFPK